MNGRSFVLAAALAGCLAGCVSEGPFPSLAPRPAEQEDWAEEPEHSAPAVADDAALRARLSALIADAREGERRFEGDRPEAERATAHHAAQESDAWIEAQQAISRLEAARGRTDE